MFSIFFLCLFSGSQHFDIVFAATPSPSPPTAADSPDPQKGGSDIAFTLTCGDGGNNVMGFACKDSSCRDCNGTKNTNCWANSTWQASNPTFNYTCPSCDASTNNYYVRCRSSKPPFYEYTQISSAAMFACKKELGCACASDGECYDVNCDSNHCCPQHYSWNGQTCVIQNNPSDLTIYPGWNLISVPCISVTNVIGDQCRLFSKPVYQLNRNTNIWEAYKWENIVGGKAYWIYSEASTACGLTINCYGKAAVEDIPTLKTGYNMIGVASDKSYTLNSIIGSCIGKIVNNEVLYWDSSSNSWIPKGLTDNLDPGKGYFVNVNAECKFG